MKIQSVGVYNSYQQNNIPRKINNNSYNQFQKAQEVSINFTGINGNISDKLVRLFHFNPLYLFENFSKTEYLNLSHSEILKLRAKYNDVFARKNSLGKMIETEVLHNCAANCAKKVFDTAFGEENYVVITIGRSLSSIGKALGYKIGENNVHNIPMSNIGRFVYDITNPVNYAKYIENLKFENVGELVKYLESIGLGRKNIESSGKKYILTDFCQTGRSLIGAENIFKSEYVWGNKLGNIFRADFMDVISAIDEKSLYEYSGKLFKNPKDKFDLYARLNDALLRCDYKKYSAINKANSFKEVAEA
ncbi:MAG: hypothetical protein K2F57_02145 [Candidatus Gastranaerophilales bacterium]|nr:hypothetical protein [Candidatus Gastranaerophilales bacterium]